jgi:hypothetical protein
MTPVSGFFVSALAGQEETQPGSPHCKQIVGAKNDSLRSLIGLILDWMGSFIPFT